MTIRIRTDSNEIYREFVDEFLRIVKSEGTRKTFNGNRKQRYAGKYGEAIVINEIGLNLQDYIDSGFKAELEYNRVGGDYGIDVEWDGIYIDVKTLIVNIPVAPGISRAFYHNYNLGQAQDPNNQTDIIIFCIMNVRERMLAICGGVAKQEMVDPEYSISREKGEEKVRPGGSIHRYQEAEYEITQGQIVNFEKTQDLKGYIYAYGQYKKGHDSNFQRAEKKRIFEYPQKEVYPGNGILAEIHESNGEKNNNPKEGARK